MASPRDTTSQSTLATTSIPTANPNPVHTTAAIPAHSFVQDSTVTSVFSSSPSVSFEAHTAAHPSFPFLLLHSAVQPVFISLTFFPIPSSPTTLPTLILLSLSWSTINLHSFLLTQRFTFGVSSLCHSLWFSVICLYSSGDDSIDSAAQLTHSRKSRQVGRRQLPHLEVDSPAHYQRPSS